MIHPAFVLCWFYVGFIWILCALHMPACVWESLAKRCMDYASFTDLLQINHLLESTPEHPLAIERQRFRIHH